MTPNWIKSSTPRARRPRGLTLVEVVAGLALMASVVSSMLWAKTRFDGREAAADRRLRAVAAADAIIAQWWKSTETFPRDSGGEVADDPTLVWRTRSMPNAAVDRLRGQIVRLEVLARSPEAAGEAPLAVLDIVLPQEVKRRE